ncbi:MAG: ZIP family metal transporter [Candidatus Micrarchaeota archaeon]
MTIDLFFGAIAVTLATSLGAITSSFFNKMASRWYVFLLAFSAGMMTYAAIEMFNESNRSAGIEIALTGFFIGVVLIFIAEKAIPHLHKHIKKTDIPTSKKKVTLVVGTIVLHNIPEGFAVAAAFAVSPTLGWFITTAIAIQDVPEGALVTGPLAYYGLDNKKSVFYGIMSGVVEGLSAIIGYVFLTIIVGITPIALGISAGAMTYVVLMELLPDAFEKQENRAACVLAFLGGITLTILLAGLFS